MAAIIFKMGAADCQNTACHTQKLRIILRKSVMLWKATRYERSTDRNPEQTSNGLSWRWLRVSSTPVTYISL